MTKSLSSESINATMCIGICNPSAPIWPMNCGAVFSLGASGKWRGERVNVHRLSSFAPNRAPKENLFTDFLSGNCGLLFSLIAARRGDLST